MKSIRTNFIKPVRNKMKTSGIIIYCFTFTAYAVLFGDYFTRFSISRDVWLIITAAATIILAADFIYENFFHKK